MIKRAKKKIVSLISFYNDLQAIKTAFPTIVKVISTLVVTVEGNRIAIDMISKELKGETIVNSDEKMDGNDGNWIN